MARVEGTSFRQNSPGIVAVCIATFSRPEQLRLLLDDLTGQSFAPGWAPAELLIVVADNALEGSAKPVVDAYEEASPHTVVYVHEPQRGVVHARNASVREARRLGADWCAFIDDDERPVATWLSCLLETARQTGASAVAGPVPERFSYTPPAWYVAAGFDEPETYPTGSTVQRFGVGNLVVSMAALEDVASLAPGPSSTAYFDVRFNSTGGEDLFLGEQLKRTGHRMVWCDEAVATTDVPSNRVQVRWVMKRQFNAYRNYSRALRLANGRQPWGELGRSAGRLVEAAGRVAGGLIARDRGAVAAGLHIGAGALGKFAGTLERGSKAGWWD